MCECLPPPLAFSPIHPGLPANDCASESVPLLVLDDYVRRNRLRHIDVLPGPRRAPPDSTPTPLGVPLGVCIPPPQGF